MGAEIRETHVSVITLVGDRAFKMKKPVKLPFLDFSSVEKRAEACRREVELNRRLSPDVYLGVATVFGVDGEPCEHLVVMRRMPDERRLGFLVQRHEAREDDVVAIARTVARFHETCDRSAAITSDGSADAFTQRWIDNLDQTRGFTDSILDPETHRRVERLALRYLQGRRPLFEARALDGKIVDGHGDLLADDIYCFDDGPRILDCIEFADRLRHVDVADDVAFLAMDLERLGAPDLSRRLLSAYAETSGDAPPTTLLHHFMAYRALVRCKVACLRAGEDAEGAGATAAALLELSLGHCASANVRLVLTGGSPGTGKSTLATALGQRMDWQVLRSDLVRKELAGVPVGQPSPAGRAEGIYSPEMTERTYDGLLRRAQLLLTSGESVILDATWADDRHRASAARLARDTASELVSLRCTAPMDVVERRIASRAVAGVDVSDATVDVARAIAAEFAPWPDAVDVDAAAGLDASLAAALSAIG